MRLPSAPRAGTRRVLWIAAAAAVLAVALLPGLRALEAELAARALDHGVVCTDATREGCLRPVAIELGNELDPGEDYPYPASTHTWTFRTTDGARAGAFDLGSEAANTLSPVPRGPVVGLFHGDHLVAIDTGSGRPVATAYAGPRGALLPGLLAGALVGLALLLAAAGFAARAPRVAGWTLLATAVAGMAPFAFGGLTWLSLLLMAVTVAAAVVLSRAPDPPATPAAASTVG